MKRIFTCIIATFLLMLSGCAKISPRDNFNPKMEQKINNQNGRIDSIENNQNAIRAEIDRISLINKENHNNGVQILQGDGAYIVIFGLVTIGIICYYFYRVAENYRKTAEILATEIRESNDNELKMRCFKAAQHTEVEDKIYALVQKK